jgi:lipopolysaccharide export system protein LptA
MKIPLHHLLAAAVCAAPALAQKPAEAPRPEDELHRQIEAVSGATPTFKGLPPRALAVAVPPAEEAPAKPPVKKEKGPTEIDSLEATFDQKANEAVFIGDVVVTDPEFNVKCDKLTAYLKPAEKAGPAAAGTAPKPGTPAPAEPKKKGGGGGLRRAVAEANAGNRVIITQDKPDADGKTQHSVGQGDKATYDAVTGDIVLTGKPQIQQGFNLVIAAEESTVMTLNRDGHMKAKGLTKTIITDNGGL